MKEGRMDGRKNGWKEDEGGGRKRKEEEGRKVKEGREGG